MRPDLHDDDHDHDHDHRGGHSPGDRPGIGGLRRKLGRLTLAALALLLVYRTFFFVDETEYVYVTQFGDAVRLCSNPGLGVKWPYQSLWRFDRRLQMYEPPAREMLTEDKENLNFEWFVCWRIPGMPFVVQQLNDEAARNAQERSVLETPRLVESAAAEVTADASSQRLEEYVRRFLQSVGTTEAAQSRLEERIQAQMAAKIGATRLAQLVSLDPQQLKLEAIMNDVTDSIRNIAKKEFGIEVVDIRIRRFNYPEAVKPFVFAEIRSERERVAVQHRAEGASQKTKIESLATLQRDQLLAQAKREATRIRGEGEAKAIETFNAAHSKNPEFYELLKTLETYRSMLDDQTTVVLSSESPLLKLLTHGLPSLTNPPVDPSPTKRTTRPDKEASSPPKPAVTTQGATP
jgi:membrane protease subunit HflC